MVKWHKQVGDAIEEEDLVLDIATDTLAEKGQDVGKWAGELTMQVECHDEGFLACTFCDEASDASADQQQAHSHGSSMLPVGVPLAVLCESLEDLKRIREMGREPRAVLEALGSAVRRDAAWQAYVKRQASYSSNACA